jgi:hypothetical protein
MFGISNHERTFVVNEMNKFFEMNEMIIAICVRHVVGAMVM